jgi:hypothetical protein
MPGLQAGCCLLRRLRCWAAAAAHVKGVRVQGPQDVVTRGLCTVADGARQPGLRTPMPASCAAHTPLSSADRAARTPVDWSATHAACCWGGGQQAAAAAAPAATKRALALGPANASGRCTARATADSAARSHMRGAPPMVASGSRSMLYLCCAMYMMGTPGICGVRDSSAGQQRAHRGGGACAQCGCSRTTQSSVRVDGGGPG